MFYLECNNNIDNPLYKLSLAKDIEIEYLYSSFNMNVEDAKEYVKDAIKDIVRSNYPFTINSINKVNKIIFIVKKK